MGRWNYEVAWEMSEDSGTKVITLFNKVLSEDEKCVSYFYLKLKGLFGQPNNKVNRIKTSWRDVNVGRWYNVF